MFGLFLVAAIALKGVHTLEQNGALTLDPLAFYPEKAKIEYVYNLNK